MPVILPALLLACGTPAPTYVDGPDSPLTLRLVNPTSCSYCDPFQGVDTLRIDVLVGTEVVESASFSWPEDELVMPGLDGFGVVRVQLVGLQAGVVISAGRTAEIPLAPDTPIEVPILFLPSNTAIPLSATMTADRSRHVALRRRDGSVVLMGGVNPDHDGTFASVERFDPTTWTFATEPTELPGPVASPRRAWTGRDEFLMVGGFNTSPTGDVASSSTAAWSEVTGEVRATASLYAPRNGHCFAMYRERLGIVLGGNADTAAGELVKVSETTADWEFVNVPMRDFDQTQVTACVGLADETVFVQGQDAASTGIWAFGEEDSDAGEAFTPSVALGEGADRYAKSALVLPIGVDAWVAGGVDPFTGGALDDSRWFRVARNGFEPGLPLGEGRVDPAADEWIVPGTWVVGCGWKEESRLTGAESLEIVDPVTGSRSPLVVLDRDRDGCALTTLLDGTVLVTGGYGPLDDSVVDAAIVVPWID